ncbi:HAD-IA family hydrolase [Altericroceibacterium xinjiangense]|uniref:HAD-IA family hydrolase n=1 Tax=Altericroceibacterium xinjiangense TaxID=762261 RepID=UPI000F7D5FF0|nr:HAD-IA family hydrolase [Altericroceibacterium xinjiangense]
MDRFPFTAIGFDLDGTLVDSNRDLAPAINHALALAGRATISQDATRRLIGGGTRKMLLRATELTGGPLDEETFEQLYDTMLFYYEAHIADHTVPYPGCLEALDALAAHGCRLAVATNKIEHLARKLLTGLDMLDRFDVVLGGDTLGPDRAKPKGDMIAEAQARCGGGTFAFVGDSTYDVLAAKAAGIPVIALSFGYNDVPAQDLGADAVVDRFDDLLPALRRLG